ncbi:MAG: hypothetical protein HYU58_08755 [Proteobacteria bacterium]|nr:hypothetical protein [Pseudomonadota bacterium]
MWDLSAADGNDRPNDTGSALGTRFLIFPQVPHLAGYEKPEIVWVSTPPDRLRVGPEDDRIYVCDPLLDKTPYEFPDLPPFVGTLYPPAQAGPDGHFDNIDPGSREFLAAHAYASVRRVLDIWESYLGHTIEWHFADTYQRLEVIPWIDWDNAQSGYGYLELGYDRDPAGGAYPYALNFDVIAHEIGHSILFSLCGMPSSSIENGDFAPFHEANADLISLISFLHFDSGLDRLLRHCSGNLLILNELNRIAELTGDRQIRVASNSRRMSEVSSDVHDRSRPFTGAIFDTIVSEFHARLVAADLSDPRLLQIPVQEVNDDILGRITNLTAAAFTARPFLFKTALIEARDVVALALVRLWAHLDVDDIHFTDAANLMLSLSDGRLRAALRENFTWREIL